MTCNPFRGSQAGALRSSTHFGPLIKDPGMACYGLFYDALWSPLSTHLYIDVTEGIFFRSTSNKNAA